MPRYTEQQRREQVFSHEAKLQAYALKRLRAVRPFIYLIKTSQRNQAGVPDVIMCVKGRFVAIELKRYDGSTSALQEEHLKRIGEADGIKGVAYNWGECVDIINRVEGVDFYELERQAKVWAEKQASAKAEAKKKPSNIHSA